MPRACTICTHDQKQEIDRALLEGQTLRSISQQFAVSTWALARHRDSGHIPAAIIKALEVEEVADASDLLGQMQRLHARTLSILSDAELRGDQRTALAAVREARGNLELLTKLYVLLVGKPSMEGLTIRVIDETIPIPNSKELERGGEFDQEDEA